MTDSRWPKARALSVKSEARSSAVPKTPSGPARTSETRVDVSSVVSMGSLNTTSNERTRNTRAPSATLVETTLGGKVSGTTSSTTALDSVVLPPVSVARTCTVTLLPPMAIEGIPAKSSNGKATSLETTWPLTSNSTLRTCTSSVTVGTIRSVAPSCTWVPGVAGSTSTASTDMLTVGATPLVS